MKLFQKISNFYSYIILFALLLLFSFFSVKSYNTQYEQRREKINTTRSKITIECTIVSFPRVKETSVQAIGEIKKCSVSEIAGQKLLFKFPPEDCSVRKGDKIRLSGTAEIAPGASNPGSFDYGEYLKSQNVTGICTVEDKGYEIIANAPKFLGKIYRLREKLVTKSDSVLPYGASGLLRAVVGGDRTDIDPKDETSFKKAGVYHIVAISGLHLNIFICAVYAYIRKLKAKRKTKAILSVVSCLAIGLFVLIFTGFGISVIRAFIMSVIFALASLGPRHYNSKYALVITGFAVVIFTPYSLYSVAFQLSFLSTMGVLLALDFLEYLKENERFQFIYNNPIGQTFCISFFTTLCTLFITTRSFGYIPLFSWLANLLILPVMPILLGTGAFFTAAVWFLPSPLLNLCGFFITGLYAYVSFISKIVSGMYGATVDIYADILWYVFVCTLFLGVSTLLFFRKKLKAFAITSVIFVVAVGGFLVYNMKDSQEITVTFADVGQGDSCLIESGNSSVIIDCGTSYNEEYYASSIEEMLRHKNIRKVDVAIVTHYHIDHTNIMEKLLADGKIRKLVLPAYYDSTESKAKNTRERLLFAAMKSNTEISYVKAGDSILWGDDKAFEFLLPDGNMYFSTNDMSLVSRFTYGEVDFLFCGDAANNELEQCLKKDVECDVLKVTHHGGYSELSKEFIKKAKPEYAIVSCAKHNRYNHPDGRILDILKTEDCHIERTDVSGAIIVKTNKEKVISVNGMR